MESGHSQRCGIIPPVVPFCTVLLALVGALQTPVTNIVTARNAPAAWAAEKRPFSLVGHIIRQSSLTRNCSLWACPEVVSLSEFPTGISVAEDDLVRITGHFDTRGKMLRRIIDGVQTIRRGVRPTPIPITAAQCTGTEFFPAYVRLQVVLVKIRRDAVDPRYLFLVLRDQTGVATAVVKVSQWPADGDALLDAEIGIEGVTQEQVGWREGLSTILHVSATAPIEIIRAAPKSMQDIPVLKSRRFLHRQKTVGTVLATTEERFFINRSVRHGFMEIRPGKGVPTPSVGTAVTVAGFARLDPFHTMLDEALVEVKADDPDPKPELLPTDIRLSDLIVQTNNGERINTKLHGRIVSCRGVVRRSAASEPTDGRFLLSEGGLDITVDMSGIPPTRRTPPASGSTISATGLLLAEFENPDDYAALPVFRRFTLIPRSPDEITVLKKPDWWTPPRLLSVIVVLAIALIAFIIWNRSLHTLSERRGRELFRARFASAQSELKVGERTRLAVELHDSLSQTLTGVALQIETASSFADALPDSVKRLLDTAKQMLASCRGELQSCIWDLRSRTFDEKDMTEAVTRTVDTHIGSARLSVRFNVPRRRLSETTTHAILRIVRELAVNAVRHGEATEIRIAGNLDDGVIRFSVTDNGKGFEPDAAPGPRDGHFGLQGVRERLNEFAGTLEIESRVGKGTRIKVTMKPRDDQ